MTSKLTIFLSELKYTMNKDEFDNIVEDIIHELLRGQQAKEEAGMPKIG